MITRSFSCVILFDGHAFLKPLNRYILFQMRRSFIDKGDDRGVEIMFDCKHVPSLARLRQASPPRTFIAADQKPFKPAARRATKVCQ